MIQKKIFKFLINFFILFFLNNLSSALADAPIYQLEAEKIIYQNNNSIIVAEGNASAINKYGKKIFANKIIYDKKNSIIKTEENSIYIDEFKNKLTANFFVYNLNKKEIKASQNIKFTDSDENIFYFNELIYFLEQERGIGTKFRALLIDKSSLDGTFAEFDNKKKIISLGDKNKNEFEKYFDLSKKNKNAYTPCKTDIRTIEKKTIEERCPDWSLETQNTINDKNKQMVYHYGSILKIKNIPVFYLPYFSHPDPTVKRKSGFMQPSFKNFSEIGQTIKTPYFWAIDQNKDLLFTPIYYFDQNPLFMAEFRQQNLNSKFYVDTSYTEGYKKINDTNSNSTRTKGSRNHFFFNFLGNYNDLFFNKNDLEVNIQRVSNKNYLQINQINTDEVKQDISNLNNSILLNSYENNKKLSLGINIYENLNDNNSNTKYQYEIPKLSFSNFFSKFNQLINIENSFAGNNFGGDSNQIYLLNKMNTESSPKKFLGYSEIQNIFKTSINNINFYNENINEKKENFDSNVFLSGAIESSLPLIKINKNSEETLLPKILTKFTTGSMANASSIQKTLSYEDLFLMDRMNDSTNPETGLTLGYGIEYQINLKKDDYLTNESASFKIGQVLRTKTNYKMPVSSTLRDTRSAFVGTASYKLNDEFKINYEYLMSKNFNKLLKNSINSEYNFLKQSINVNFYETRDIGNEHYIEGKYTKQFKNDFNFLIGGRKNLKENFTENNFVATNYETDCIKISLNLSKKFYNNDEIKPSNDLTFSITLKPFGAPVSPNLSNFLN